MVRGSTVATSVVIVRFALAAQALEVDLNRAVERSLAPGQTEEIRVVVEANEYLRVLIEGHGALLRVAVRDASGNVIAERSRTAGVRDAMIWSGISGQAGAYRIGIESRESAGHTAQYTLLLAEKQPANDRDLLRTEAADMLAEGERQVELGSLNAATARFQESIRVSQKANDRSIEAESRYQLAQALFALGRPVDAARGFEESLALWKSANDATNEARGLRALGKLYGDTQQAAKAMEVLENALSIAQPTGDLAGQAEAYRELGSVAGARSDYTKAQELFDRGLALARQAGDRRVEADILNMLGVLHQNTGHDADALADYETALAIRRVIGDRAGIAQSTNNLGVFHRNLGDSRSAASYYEESLAIRRQLGNPQGIANSLENLAVAKADLGNFEESLDLSRQAADLFHSSQAHRGEMFALMNLGDVYSRMGDAEQALDFYGRAMDIAKAVGDRRGQATALISAGSVNASRKRPGEALGAYLEALQISREARNQREAARALLALAELELLRGESQAAAARGSGALEAIRALDDRREEARALSLVGSALMDTEPSRGTEMLNQALAIQQEIVDPDQEALIHSRLARGAERSGDLAAARHHALTAIDLLESVRRTAPPEGPRISFQAYKRPFYEQAAEILMMMHEREPQAGFDAEAFQVSERARARALLDQMMESKDLYGRGANPALADEASRTLELLDSKTARFTRILSRPHAEAQAVAARREINELEARFNQIRARIRSNCRQCAGSLEPQPASLAEIQTQALEKRAILLEYMLGSEHSYLWVISRSTVRSYVLPSREQISRLVDQARSALAEPGCEIPGESPESSRSRAARSYRQFERTAAALSKALLPPGLDLRGRAVLIVPDGPLYQLPFAPLLFHTAELTMLPSGSSLVRLRQNRENRGQASTAIALFADPQYPEDSFALPRLPLSREEVQRIAALIPWKKRPRANPPGPGEAKQLRRPRRESRCISSMGRHGIVYPNSLPSS